MKKRFTKQFKLLVLLTVLFVSVLSCTSAGKGEKFALTIAHFNDSHANLEPSVLKITFNVIPTSTKVGGFPAFTAKIKQLRQTKKNFLALHAGDLFQGTLYFQKEHGLADLEFLKLMKLDAMGLGNHEFDEGPGVLARFIAGVQDQFPLVCANISITNNALPPGKIKPYTIKTLGKRKVGIIGLITPDTWIISSPGNDLSFSDPIETAKKMTAELTGKNVNIIIVLSHLGRVKDLELAAAVPGIDVIVGGHSHTLMGTFARFPDDFSPISSYPFVIRNSTGEITLLVHAWENAKVLGILDVEFDGDGKVTGYSGNPLFLTGNKPADFKQKNAAGKNEPVSQEMFETIEEIIKSEPYLEKKTEDPEAEALLDKYMAAIVEMKKTVIGRVETDLLHVREPGRKHEIAGVLEHGSQIAPKVAEALLWKARSLKHKNTQVVIQNAGNARCDIPAGDITIDLVYKLLPYNNRLVLFDIRGAQLKEVIKNAVLRGDGSFPYPAGLRYSADLSKKENGFFTRLEVLNGNGWVPFDEEAVYHIAANSFIASGKDDYKQFGEVKDKEDTGFTNAEVFMEYIKEFKTITDSEPRVSLVR